MSGFRLLFVAAVFVLAGLVKGVLGLGLPTISMGLLAIVMPPVEAAALLLLPSFLTNVWQMLDGPGLREVTIRLWPMMLAVCGGTWIGAGLMTGAYAGDMTAWLGVILVLYALTGFTPLVPRIPPRHQTWSGVVCGAATGLITAATGVFVIPAVPYLQAIGFEKDELVQALGLSFTVSTLALAVNIAKAGVLDWSLAGATAVAVLAASGGMWLGQVVRGRLEPVVFRRAFFAGLLVLGCYLAVGALH